MSGHSKWATIKRHKAAVDAKRGKKFSVIAKEISMAARDGGSNPEFNMRLRTLLSKAKAANMPSDNIERAIKKGTGELPGQSYEQLTYEGYGPGGVGIIVEVTTDNKNRSAADVRSAFTKYGGKLAVSGALSFNFHRLGQFLISAEKTNEEKLMDIVIDAGAEDIKNMDDHFEVICPMASYDEVSSALEKAGIESDESEIAYIPSNLINVSESDIAKRVMKLVDILDELEDVQHVYSNYDIDEKLLS